MMKKIDKLEPDVEIGHKKTISTYQKDLKLKELIDWQREMVSRMKAMDEFDWVLHVDLTKLEARVEALESLVSGLNSTEQDKLSPSKKWQPITRQAVYYFTGDGRVEWAHYHPSESLFANLERFGNLFKTKEEAEIARDKIQKLLGEL